MVIDKTVSQMIRHRHMFNSIKTVVVSVLCRG